MAAPTTAAQSDTAILNHCVRYLARTNADARHNYKNCFASDDPRARIAEAWRFPLIDSYRNPDDPDASRGRNAVTFVYTPLADEPPQSVSVVGTFGQLYEPLPLRRLQWRGQPTDYYATTVVVPHGQIHTYKFWVDGELVPDPLNPQQQTSDKGERWSRFFGHYCTQPLTLERWEYEILDRLTDHILPFRTAAGRRFLARHYDRSDRERAGSYQLDRGVGAANFIDKLLVREERYNLVDYRICLDLLRTVLKAREPYTDPGRMARQTYVDLYDELAGGEVADWDYQRYQNPTYFLKLLRRHTYTGAFAHPKYGGNIGAAGWAYLASRYPFDWARAMEEPLGTNPDYWG